MRMSTKKQKPKHRGLLLDDNAQRYSRWGSNKTYVSRKGSLISTKELKRRELQRAKDVGYDPVNFKNVEKTDTSKDLLVQNYSRPVANVGTLTKAPFWIRVAMRVGKLLSRIFKWGKNVKQAQE